MTRKNLVGAALAVLTTGLALTLAGCGTGSNTGGHDTSRTSATAEPSGDHNDADIAFARDMIPHHEGAIEMAGLARGRTGNATILDLAARVEQAQDPEIKTMTGWLDAWGVETSPDAGHDAHGSTPGMMSAEESDRLKAAKDTDFDRMFLAAMIEHHRGAIDMAQAQLRQGRNADAKELARRIIDAQQAEITEMEGLLPQGD
ncbi:DUF305 domain-containing protein [Saccharothrix stipae]